MQSLTTYAQDKATVQIHKFSYSDASIVGQISDNGLWGVAQPSLSDAQQSGRAKLVNIAEGTYVVLQTEDEVARDGVCYVSDVTDDGNIVAGSVKGMPAYWTKSTGEWTLLPLPKGWDGGSLSAITPDGKYAIGNVVNAGELTWSKGVLWDLTSNTIVELTNIPTLDMTHEIHNQHSFRAISSDGRYILAAMSYSFVMPTSLCAYVYDVQNQTCQFVGFTPNDTNPWTPAVDGLLFVDAPTMSANGHWVTGSAYMVKALDGSDFPDEYEVAFRYNTQNGTMETFEEAEDRGMMGFSIDNSGHVFAATPVSSPIREWSVRYGNYWYPASQIVKQRYGVDFYAKTGFDNTGTPLSVTTDGSSVVSMVDPLSGEGYVMSFPESIDDLCQGINLLENYNISPVSGASFTKLRNISIKFNRNVKVLAAANSISLKDADGNVVRNSLAFNIDTADPQNVIIEFRTTTLEAGKTYTVTIPAGSVSLVNDETKTNSEINITYTGRSADAMAVTNVYPAAGSELAKLDNVSSPVILTFDALVAKTESASAKLVRESDGATVSNLSVLIKDNQVALMPASTQYLYKGQTYKVVLSAGSITDLTGGGANAEYTVSYTGTYERAVSPDDENVFADDFSNMAQSIKNFMRYEGDHLTPTSEMAAWGFDADNQPWNYSLRDDNSTDYCVASHSMYTPSGKSDDWMVTPQLTIPDNFCNLSFDAQSYINGKNDVLKVLVWQTEESVNDLTAEIVSRMKAEAEVVFEQTLSPGSDPNTLAGDWTHYNVDLSKFGGKNIYIAFLNDNESQSAIFVDNILVKRNLKYLMSLNNDQSVVDQDNIDINGKIVVNSDNDTFSSVALTLIDADGNEIDKVSQTGLALKKGDSYSFDFSKPLPLVKKQINPFSIRVQLDDYTDLMKSTVKNLAFAPTKRVLVEEMTGTTCPNCPQGILAIEKMQETFGEQVIPVSIHTYDGDQLGAGLSSYSTFLSLMSAPSGIINRNSPISYPMWQNPVTGDFEFSNGKNLWMDYVNEELASPAEAEISAKVELNEAAQTFSVPVDVKFALDGKNLNLNVFMVLMEDGIVSFQQNNFGGYADAALGDWGKDGMYSNTINYNITHNDVVRACWGSTFYGTPGLLPQAMTAGEVYTAEINDLMIPENISDVNRAKVAVVLIDANTDKVVNSVVAYFNPSSGIESATSSDSFQMQAFNGGVNIACQGDFTAQAYSISGTLLSSVKGSGTASLSTQGYKGAAIVKVTTAAGQMVKKISIR